MHRPDRMPSERWPGLLARLLPSSVAREVFEPAWQDARYSQLAASAREAPRTILVAAQVRYALTLFVLFLDCWRLAISSAVGWLAMLGRSSGNPLSMSSPHHQRKPEKAAVIQYYLKHAVRRLIREPGFTIAAGLTLALGIGANTSVFAVVEAVLLRPLPYAQPNDLVIVRHRDTRTLLTKDFIAVGDYVDMQRDLRSFQSFAAFGSGGTTLEVDGERTPINALTAGPGLLETLGARPILGRGLVPDDSREGTPPVMMLSAELWESRYHSDSTVVGRSLRIGQTDRTVVGIAPRGLRFPPTLKADVILPIRVPDVAPTARRSGWLFVVARLKPSVSLAAAQRDLDGVSANMSRDFPTSNQASAYYAVPLRDALVGDTKKALTLLLGAVCVVLLIACANVANLLLARSLGRRREMAVKVALGAGRGRLALQLLTESLVLACVASLAGVAIAYWGASALVKLIPNGDNIPGLSDVHINGTVLAFTVIVTLAASLIFALVSLVMVGTKDGTSVLVSAARASMSRGARRTTSGLVGAEIALAIVLLVGAGLVTRSFSALLAVDPGFKYDRVAIIDLQLPQGRYADPVARFSAYQRIFAAMRANPLVTEVGVAAVTPLTGNNWTAPFLRSEVVQAAGEQPPEVGWQQASGTYFKAMQIPLKAGRYFDDRDSPSGAPVVIISEALQQKYFPNEDPVGKFIRQDSSLVEIVGVVGNIRRAGLTDEPRGDLYQSFERNVPGATTLFVHTRGDPERALLPLTQLLKQSEPGVTIGVTRTLADVAGESVRVTKIILWLLSIFAATALALAALGIYGVMSYVVRQRTKEIGTRMALGATRANILRLVMQEGLLIGLVGTGVGLAVGLFATRLLNSVLYNVSSSDPLTIVTATVVILLTTMVACFIPARRASSVQPAQTLAEQ